MNEALNLVWGINPANPERKLICSCAVCGKTVDGEEFYIMHKAAGLFFHRECAHLFATSLAKMSKGKGK